MLVASIFKLQDYTNELKAQGAHILELRLDLMSEQDLQLLLSYTPAFNLDLLITIKPAFHNIGQALSLCRNLQPQYIDLDFSIFDHLAPILRQICPLSRLIISKHTNKMYELKSFYKKNKDADIKKLVIETNNSLKALHIAILAKKHNMILFAAGNDTYFSRFFSAWHYCYVSMPTGAGQISLNSLNQLYSLHFKLCSFYALIGERLTQSLSHITHNRLFKRKNIECIYLKIPLQAAELQQGISLIKKLGCLGISVTTPLKSLVLSNKILNSIDLKTKKVINSDCLALAECLEGFDEFSQILLLGSGDCAKAFKKTLMNKFHSFDTWSRKQPIPLKKEYDVIINATSSGNPIDDLPKCNLLINLYRSDFLCEIEKKAMAFHAKTICGQTFFYKQAMHQFKFWLPGFKKVSIDEFFFLVKEPAAELTLAELN